MKKKEYDQMIRNIKVLMLAAVAVLAMSALTASAAQAVLFHSAAAEKTTTMIDSRLDGTGKQAHHVFDAAGRSITCPAPTFSGSQAETTSETVTIEANYGTGCTFVGQAVTVNMNGCDYLFHANGEVDITGSPCNGITFEAKNAFGEACHVEVGAQTGLKEVTYKEIAGPPREITVEPHVTGIKYTSKGALCLETGTLANGTYTTGNTIVSGTEAGKQVSVWVE